MAFEIIKDALDKNGSELTKKVGGVFLFKVAGGDGKTGMWLVDAKNGSGSVAIAPEGVYDDFHLGGVDV